MKRSQLRKLIRETIIKEQVITDTDGNDLCHYCLDQSYDTGVTVDWFGNPQNPIVGPGGFSAQLYGGEEGGQFPGGVSPFPGNGCISNTYGFQIGPETECDAGNPDSPCMGSLDSSVSANCSYIPPDPQVDAPDKEDMLTNLGIGSDFGPGKVPQTGKNISRVNTQPQISQIKEEIKNALKILKKIRK